jgi:glycolate oxidase FAD binding subunit
MTGVLRPANAEDLIDAIATANAERTPLEIVARGTKREFGRAVNAGALLDVSAFSFIEAYEPEELVLTAAAATPMREIEAALAERRQMLAFEPQDLGPLYGQAANAGTLGGVLACGLSGPRRIKAGAARDHFLGFSAVSGRGERFKAGGKVVKNVTGYDLPKLMAGSFGTLAVLTSVTVKVLPAGDKSRTVLAFGLSDQAAIALLAEALNSPNEVSGAAHLPREIARRSDASFVADAGAAVTAIRVEGTAGSVAARCAALRALIGARAPSEELHTMRTSILWREIRDVAKLLPDGAAAIWRVSVPPSAGAALVAGLRATRGAECYFDWGGGLIWLATAPRDDAGAAPLRTLVAASGGHATLMRGPADLRARVPVFEPQAGALAQLTRRVKGAYDPAQILNPGRLTAGA